MATRTSLFEGNTSAAYPYGQSDASRQTTDALSEQSSAHCEEIIKTCATTIALMEEQHLLFEDLSFQLENRIEIALKKAHQINRNIKIAIATSVVAAAAFYLLAN